MKLIPHYTISIDKEFTEESLTNDVYLSIIHATRIPPHIGIIAGKEYHSLTIKGQETGIPAATLIRNSMQRKIPSLFIKMKPNKRFNNEELKKNIVSCVLQFPKVAVNVATCLSPVKLFFEQSYDVPAKNVNYVFELLPVLEAKGLIDHASSMFIESTAFTLPLYDMKEINTGIDKANTEAAQALGSLKINNQIQ